MTSNSLTQNEEYDISSQILKTILDACPSYFSDPNMCGSDTFVCWFYTTRIDLYSYQLS